jgi:hypothetical protein
VPTSARTRLARPSKLSGNSRAYAAPGSVVRASSSEAKLSPEVADAACVLSERHSRQLQTFACLIQPHSDRIDQKFERRLRDLGFQEMQARALLAITPGAAARLIAQGRPALTFIEQVEYNGRRLAKMNLAPPSILEALREYEKLLTAALEPRRHWKQGLDRVHEQLHFCVILTLNNAYYQVREAETQAFYDQFRIELEAQSLDELLKRLLESLARTCHADAGCLYWANPDGTGWVCKTGHKRRWPAPLDFRERLPDPRCLDVRLQSSDECLLDPSWKDRLTTCWSMPLAAGGRLNGVMQFGFAKEYEWLPREQELLAAAAERCLMAAESSD